MPAGFVLLLLGTVLVPGPRTRRAAALAAIAAGLALAALRAAPSPPQADFLSVNASLAALAVLLAVGGAVGAARGQATPESAAGAAALAAGGVAMAWSGLALAPDGSKGLLAGALAVVALTGTLLERAGRWIRVQDGEIPLRMPARAAAGLAAGLVLVAAGPHLGLVFLGAITAGWSGWLIRRAEGRSRVPVAPVLVLLLLPAYRFMAIVAGPEGLGMRGLGELPFSPAAALALAPVFLLTAWSLSGLWPLQRQQPGPFTATAGLLLLIRVALPTVADGLVHWRPLAAPVFVIGLWHAGLSRRWALTAVALAGLGAIGPGPDGPVGAGLLLAGALLLEAASRLESSRLATAARAAATLAMGWGALLAVASGLRAEVVYTVLAVAGLVAAAGRAGAAQAITASAPNTAAPSS